MSSDPRSAWHRSKSIWENETPSDQSGKENVQVNASDRESGRSSSHPLRISTWHGRARRPLLSAQELNILPHLPASPPSFRRESKQNDLDTHGTFTVLPRSDSANQQTTTPLSSFNADSTKNYVQQLHVPSTRIERSSNLYHDRSEHGHAFQFFNNTIMDERYTNPFRPPQLTHSPISPIRESCTTPISPHNVADIDRTDTRSATIWQNHHTSSVKIEGNELFINQTIPSSLAGDLSIVPTVNNIEPWISNTLPRSKSSCQKKTFEPGLCQQYFPITDEEKLLALTGRRPFASVPAGNGIVSRSSLNFGEFHNSQSVPGIFEFFDEERKNNGFPDRSASLEDHDINLLSRQIQHLDIFEEPANVRSTSSAGLNFSMNHTYFPAAYEHENAASSPIHYKSGLPRSFAQHGLQVPTQSSPSLLRGSLLNEYKTDPHNSKWELRDVYGHIVDFCGDQAGSKFIQHKLEIATIVQREKVFQEILPYWHQLMNDVFGNWVMQRLFVHGGQNQRTILVNQMKGRVLSLSRHMYGCRVLQKALKYVLEEEQAFLVKELEASTIPLIKDQNGNHVIQKVIKRVPMHHIHLIVDHCVQNLRQLAVHPYGCRVVQRLLKHYKGPHKAGILQDLHAFAPKLIVDQFGNYVTQHIIQFGASEDRLRMMTSVFDNLVYYAKQKFASNVVEKCIATGTEEQKRAIMLGLSRRDAMGHSPLASLIRDSFGNYVIQKLLDVLNDGDYRILVSMLEPEIARTSHAHPSKQAENVYKKMFRFARRGRFEADAPPSHDMKSSTLPDLSGLYSLQHSNNTHITAGYTGRSSEYAGRGFFSLSKF